MGIALNIKLIIKIALKFKQFLKIKDSISNLDGYNTCTWDFIWLAWILNNPTFVKTWWTNF